MAQMTRRLHTNGYSRAPKKSVRVQLKANAQTKAVARGECVSSTHVEQKHARHGQQCAKGIQGKQGILAQQALSGVRPPDDLAAQLGEELGRGESVL